MLIVHHDSWPALLRWNSQSKYGIYKLERTIGYHANADHKSFKMICQVI